MASTVGLSAADKHALICDHYSKHGMHLSEIEKTTAQWFIDAGLEHAHVINALDSRPRNIRIADDHRSPDVASHRGPGTAAPASAPPTASGALPALPRSSPPVLLQDDHVHHESITADLAEDAVLYEEPTGQLQNGINDVEQIESRATSLAITEPIQSMPNDATPQFDPIVHNVRPMLPSPVLPRHEEKHDEQRSVVLTSKMTSSLPSPPPGCPATAETRSAMVAEHTASRPCASTAPMHLAPKSQPANESTQMPQTSPDKTQQTHQHQQMPQNPPEILRYGREIQAPWSIENLRRWQNELEKTWNERFSAMQRQITQTQEAFEALVTGLADLKPAAQQPPNRFGQAVSGDARDVLAPNRFGQTTYHKVATPPRELSFNRAEPMPKSNRFASTLENLTTTPMPLFPQLQPGFQQRIPQSVQWGDSESEADSSSDDMPRRHKQRTP